MAVSLSHSASGSAIGAARMLGGSAPSSMHVPRYVPNVFKKGENIKVEDPSGRLRTCTIDAIHIRIHYNGLSTSDGKRATEWISTDSDRISMAAAAYRVSGAGSKHINGNYRFNGEFWINGKNRLYFCQNPKWDWKIGASWWIADENGNNDLYYGQSNSTRLPADGWVSWKDAGQLPAPKVVAIDDQVGKLRAELAAANAEAVNIQDAAALEVESLRAELAEAVTVQQTAESSCKAAASELTTLHAEVKTLQAQLDKMKHEAAAQRKSAKSRVRRLCEELEASKREAWQAKESYDAVFKVQQSSLEALERAGASAKSDLEITLLKLKSAESTLVQRDADLEALKDKTLKAHEELEASKRKTEARLEETQSMLKSAESAVVQRDADLEALKDKTLKAHEELEASKRKTEARLEETQSMLKSAESALVQRDADLEELKDKTLKVREDLDVYKSETEARLEKTQSMLKSVESDLLLQREAHSKNLGPVKKDTHTFITRISEKCCQNNVEWH